MNPTQADKDKIKELSYNSFHPSDPETVKIEPHVKISSKGIPPSSGTGLPSIALPVSNFEQLLRKAESNFKPDDHSDAKPRKIVLPIDDSTGVDGSIHKSKFEQLRLFMADQLKDKRVETEIKVQRAAPKKMKGLVWPPVKPEEPEDHRQKSKNVVGNNIRRLVNAFNRRSSEDTTASSGASLLAKIAQLDDVEDPLVTHKDVETSVIDEIFPKNVSDKLVTPTSLPIEPYQPKKIEDMLVFEKSSETSATEHVTLPKPEHIQDLLACPNEGDAHVAILSDPEQIEAQVASEIDIHAVSDVPSSNIVLKSPTLVPIWVRSFPPKEEYKKLVKTGQIAEVFKKYHEERKVNAQKKKPMQVDDESVPQIEAPLLTAKDVDVPVIPVGSISNKRAEPEIELSPPRQELELFKIEVAKQSDFSDKEKEETDKIVNSLLRDLLALTAQKRDDNEGIATAKETAVAEGDARNNQQVVADLLILDGEAAATLEIEESTDAGETGDGVADRGANSPSILDSYNLPLSDDGTENVAIIPSEAFNASTLEIEKSTDAGEIGDGVSDKDANSPPILDSYNLPLSDDGTENVAIIPSEASDAAALKFKKSTDSGETADGVSNKGAEESSSPILDSYNQLVADLLLLGNSTTPMLAPRKQVPVIETPILAGEGSGTGMQQTLKPLIIDVSWQAEQNLVQAELDNLGDSILQVPEKVVEEASDDENTEAREFEEPAEQEQPARLNTFYPLNDWPEETEEELLEELMNSVDFLEK